MKDAIFNPGYYDNGFPLPSLKAVKGIYQLVAFKGIPEADEEVDRHIGRLARDLGRLLNAPATIISEEGNTLLAVGSDKSLPDHIDLPPYAISLYPASDVMPLPFVGGSERERYIALEFLRRTIRDILNYHPGLWRDVSRYVQRKPEIWQGSSQGVDRYPGFWLGITPSEDGGFAVSFDRTYAYLEGRPLALALSEEQLNEVTGCRCLYRYGLEWYRVEVRGPGVQLGDHRVPDPKSPKGPPITLLELIKGRWRNYAIPEINDLKADDWALFYTNEKGEVRAAATKLLYQILGTDNSVVQELHDLAILPPDARLQESLAIRHQYLPTFQLFGMAVETGPQPKPIKMQQSPDPTLLFGGNKAICASGRERLVQLKEPQIGPLTRTQFGPQYVLLPDTLPPQVRDDFIKRIGDTIAQIYPHPYVPEVLIYRGGARRLREQINAMESMLKDKHGHLLQILPRNAAHDLHDHLKRIQWDHLQSQCAKEETILGFYELHDGEYRIKSTLNAKYKFYLRGLALVILAVNRKWLWRLEDETLHAKAHLGIDVYRGTAAFTSVYRDGQEIFFRLSHSAGRERLSRDQVRTELVNILSQDLPGLHLVPKIVVIHRDGKLLIPERHGLEDAQKMLIQRGLVPPDFQFVTIEIHKTSTYRPRFFFITKDGQAKNPQMGIYRKFPPGEAILATTGAPLLKQGTARPLHLKVSMGTMPIDHIISDVYSLCHLGFTAPVACHRLPITIALADDVLRGMTPGEPEDDVWEKEDIIDASEDLVATTGGIS